MTYLIAPKTMAAIINMVADGTISKNTGKDLQHYYEAKRRLEIGQGSQDELKADFRYLKYFHELT